MANPGGGAKFASVNLNKSYVQRNPGSNGRNRPTSGGYRSNSGGGMVVLSRQQKVSASGSGSKLTVPPPLNLPSLRRENERMDLLGSAGGSGVGVGSGARPGSGGGGIGWSKPGSHTVKDVVVDKVLSDGTGKVKGGLYMPPSVRGDSSVVAGNECVLGSVEKVSVLRGEDFPSLQAAATVPLVSQKQNKDGGVLGARQKQSDSVIEQKVTMDGLSSSLVVDSYRPKSNQGFKDDYGRKSERNSEPVWKRDDYLSGPPLPLVRLNPRSDWADDERDTSHGLLDRGRNSGVQKNEEYWEGEFDMPRSNILRPKSTHTVSERWGQRDNEAGRYSSSGVQKLDPYGRVLRTPSREGREGNLRTSLPSGDMGYAPAGRQPWNNINTSRGTEQNTRDRFGSGVHSGIPGNSFQNSFASKSSYSSGGKGLSMNDPVLNFGRDKHSFFKSDKTYPEDPFMDDFGAPDPFSGDLVSVVKRKKDVLKQPDFHDPVRESFEAELERIQKMQEQDRQRIVEQQEKVHELARREDEERARLAREQEEMQRRLEEEAREASQRAEQERLEAIRRVEELKKSREEAKQNYQMEEERRKQAANQMLLELEERMARRGTEATKVGNNPYNAVDDKMPVNMKEKGLARPADVGLDDYAHLKGQRWNITGDGDHYGRNSEVESEFHDNFSGSYDDPRGRQGLSHGSFYSSPPEQLYQNAEADGIYPVGRSRYSARQPRVLPPPSSTSIHRSSHRSDIEHSGPSAFLNTVNEKRELDRSATRRCDSQSSLSVSSPPSSPTHLSHDDVEESRNSLGYSTTGEGLALVGGGNALVSTSDDRKENDMGTSDFVSSIDDEEWTVDNTEQLQEQEEYDVDEDGYQEEDEVHEENDENVDLSEDFDGMHLEEKNSPRMENMVLGFNEGVEVGMPNDEFDRKNEDIRFAIPHAPVDLVGEEESFDRMKTNGQILQALDGSRQVNVDDKSRMLLETENAMQNLAVNPCNPTDLSSSSDVIGQVGSSSNLIAQHPGPSSGNMATHNPLGQYATSTVPAIQSQAEVPVKLQFGLFSGPSLIPSPVPAIQIGSIQLPLHLHPRVGPSLTQMNSPQPPLFQFGQLSYTSNASQGLLPLVPQSMSFVQPNVPANYFLNQQSSSQLPVRQCDDSFTQNRMKHDVISPPVGSQRGLVHSSVDPSQKNIVKEENPSRESTQKGVIAQQVRVQTSHIDDIINSGVQAEGPARQCPFVTDQKSVSNARETGGQVHNNAVSSQLRENYPNWQKVQRPVSGGRGKRYMYAVKPSGTKTSFGAPDLSRQGAGGFQKRDHRYVQRTEFRVRGNFDRKQSTAMVESNNGMLNNKSNVKAKGTDNFIRSGTRKVVSSKLFNHIPESESSCLAGEATSGGNIEKEGLRAVVTNQNSGEGGLKRNFCPEEDADAPLQSGVVRVFEQPGIEALSDEGEFIEVRSKRQMLNDRREQKKKEIQAKSQGSKLPRSSRPPSQTNMFTSINKVTAPLAVRATNFNSDHISSDGRGIEDTEVSAGLNTTVVNQPLAPIGTPAMKTDGQSDLRSQTVKTLQTSSLPVLSCVNSQGPEITSESKDKILDSNQTSSTTWGNSQINEQVMALTQTQLDEAMKPIQFDSHASISDQTSSANKSVIPSPSVRAKDNLFPSSSSPINSVAGKKIQFGAVTAPTVLPQSSPVATNALGSTGPSRLDIQLSHDPSVSNSGCSVFLDKEKSHSESCAQLEAAEAEAEAAASAVAVAAISNVEVASDAMGTASVSVSNSRSYKGADVDAAGVSGDQKLGSQSRTEDSLSVALPADLSVENPPISWQPLPSPQSSSQTLTHYPGGTLSQFPFYEMNSMMGGPIFAFGPQGETGSTQPQPQKSSVTGSGPHGTWQQCHSGVDSFYGSPAAYTGHFISQPGGIPGIQGPPHMVVYNHFAPVGQFSQVGLSFMGTTYIPSGKQPDWKHNPASSAMGGSEAEKTNLNMVSATRNHANLPATTGQRLAPGSPLLPMGSPLTMFDGSHFQSSPGQPAQGHWSHAPGSTLHSVPLSLPLQQQQTEGVLFPQFNQGSSVDHYGAGNRFQEPQSSASADSRRKFPVPTNTTANRLPSELGLVDTTKGQSVINSPMVSTGSETVNKDAQSSRMSNPNGQNRSSAFKHQTSQRNVNSKQHNNSSGHIHQRRGRGSQMSGPGAEWNHHRTGFHGRNQSSMERSAAPSKMKQIYVAKQASGTSTGS